MKLPFAVNPEFRIIAHRGASAYAPENTMAAFQLAVDMGVREIELDVQLTLDNEVVICHDKVLERFGYHGTVEKMNWPDLSALDMGSWFSPFLFPDQKMVRLMDVFHRYGSGLTYHVEIKGEAGDLTKQVCRLAEQFDLKDRIIVTGFSFETLKQLRRLDHALRLGWLVPKIDRHVLAKAGELALFQICPGAASITGQDVRLAHAIVPEVRAWGLHGERKDVLAMIQAVISARCDGLTIDWPDWIRHRGEPFDRQ